MNKGKDLAKNTAIISIGKICTQFMSFFLLPLYTSILNTSEYGTVDLLVSYSALLLPIVTFAIEQALFRYLVDVRSDEQKKDTIISTTVFFTLFQCCICSVILIIVQLFINNAYMPYFILMVTACICSATMLQLGRGLGDSFGYALGSFITAAVQILFNILFLVVFNMGAFGMLLATTLGNFACSAMLFTRTKSYRYLHVSSFDKATLKEMLKYSLPLVPNQLSWWTMNASDKTIVAAFLGTEFNGLLAVAHKFPNIFIQFNTIFNISWTESAVLHIHEDDAKEFFTDIISTVFKLFSCVCLGIIACIPFVMNFMAGADYFDAYFQIPIFMLSSLCNVVVSLYGVIYVAHKKTKEIALTALYAAIINAGSHLLLIGWIGLYAASVSSLLGYGAMAVYRYFHSRKYLTVKISPKVLLSVLVMFLIVFFSYYSQKMLFHIIGLVLVIIYSVYLNIGIIKTVLKSGLGALKKIGK